MSVWQDMSSAPREPRTGVRGPIVVGVDNEGNIGRTSFCHDHPNGSNVWLLMSGEGLMEWEPILWVPEPLPHQR